LHDQLGNVLDIDMAAWWRPTAINYFDRITKPKILSSFENVGGLELSNRYAGSKKAELAATAERIFAGNFIAEAEVKERAVQWVPDAMQFAEPESKDADAQTGPSEDCEEIADQAA